MKFSNNSKVLLKREDVHRSVTIGYRMLYCGEVRIANSDTAAAASVSAATSVSLLVVLTLEVIMAVSSYADDWEFSSNDNSLLYLPLAHYSPGKWHDTAYKSSTCDVASLSCHKRGIWVQYGKVKLAELFRYKYWMTRVIKSVFTFRIAGQKPKKMIEVKFCLVKNL